mgnify:CR=1 FL=1
METKENLIEHFCYYDKPAEFPEHFHTSCELMYIHKGCLNLHTTDKTITLTDNSLYFIPSCVKHSSQLVNKEIYQRTLIIINPWAYGRVQYSLPINNLMMGHNFKKVIALSDTFNAKSLIKKMYKEYKEDNILKTETLSSLITLLLSEMIRNSNTSIKSMPPTDEMIIKIAEYIRKNSSKSLMISDIADYFNVSKYYLTHCFTEKTGMSPRQYLNYVRISNAYTLLYNKALSISEISEICGFTSPSDMTKRFHEQYNMTPVQFRKKISSNETVFYD